MLAQGTVDASDITSVQKDGCVVVHLVYTELTAFMTDQFGAIQDHSFVLFHHFHRNRLYDLFGGRQVVPDACISFRFRGRECDGRYRVGDRCQFLFAVFLGQFTQSHVFGSSLAHLIDRRIIVVARYVRLVCSGLRRVGSGPETEVGSAMDNVIVE